MRSILSIQWFQCFSIRFLETLHSLNIRQRGVGNVSRFSGGEGDATLAVSTDLCSMHRAVRAGRTPWCAHRCGEIKQCVVISARVRTTNTHPSDFMHSPPLLGLSRLPVCATNPKYAA